MADIKDVEKILREIKGDWKVVNNDLKRLIEKSTEAITRIDVYLERPFYKRSFFWVHFITMLIILIAALYGINNGGCVKIKEFITIGSSCT